MRRIGVIGSGAWATTAAKILAENGHSVIQCCHRIDYVNAIQTLHENILSLPGIKLPLGITASLNIEDLEAVDSWVICIPSKFLDTLLPLRPIYRGQSIISLIKGLPDHSDIQSVSDYIQANLGCDDLAVLSGPNLALELANQKPGASVIAAHHAHLCRNFQHLFSRPYFRIYTSDDRCGVELGGVLKNVYAVAAGIADGLRLGTNAKSALMTRALSEMVRIGVTVGANPTTFYGLSGIGDLMATAYSQSSRNWQCGFNLAQTSHIDRNDRGIAEGARTALLLNSRLQGLDVPILSAVATVLTGEATVTSVMTQLMQRELKSE